MATNDLERAFKALSSKLADYNLLFKYASGDQPLIYSTERLRQTFHNINARFTQNWCSVVINATLDRLQLNGWDAKNSTANGLLDGVWNGEGVALDAHEAHAAALITGEAFVIVWPSEDGIEIYYNDPRLCHMFYDPERPKIKQFSAKWWNGGDAWYITLYYPDRMEYYKTDSKNKPSSAAVFRPMEPASAPNPYGIIPVFHLRANRGQNQGELANIRTLQDAVNKLLADMMVSAEFGAFPQRYIITDSDTSTLKNNPGEIWTIPAGDGQGQSASAGQFQPTQLNNYLDAIDKLASSIAIISRTPKHYFFNAGASLSGEALIAMESPLTKKVDQYQAVFGATWKEIGAFVSALKGTAVEQGDIIPVWEPAQSIQPYTEAQTLKVNTDAGIPLITQLKRQGWSEGEIKAMQKDDDEQKQRNAKLAPILLDEARARSDNSNDNPMDKTGDQNNG